MNVYEIVTEKIIKELENGTIPWSRPWGIEGAPINFTSKKEYRGINTFLLAMARRSTPYWLTLKQANALDGSVKAGEKGSPIVYFQWIEKEDGEEFPLLKYYTVFNADQIRGIEFPKIAARVFNPIESAETVVTGMPKRPEIIHAEPRAYYRPSTDIINMPKKELFTSEHGYYSTLFHELAHSTGHASRLDRHFKDGADCHFGSATYAKEELVAEMSNAFLCATVGIDNEIQNNAAYIASWLKALKNDRKMAVVAAAQAQKVADFILNKKEVV